MQYHYFKTWGWIPAYILICAIWLEFSLKETYHEIDKLKTTYTSLKEEFSALELEKVDLTMQINSQSDPAWVELVLIRELGLVPEGQIKVYFGQNSD